MSVADLPESLHAKLRKIKALAERGSHGEKENAMRMLEDLCRIHGVSPELLLSDEKRWFNFTFRNPWQRKLLSQCLFHVLQIREYSYRKQSTTLSVEMTAEQAIDVRACFSHYKKLWEEQLDDMFTAFVQKHRIFAPAGTEADDDDDEPMDPERLARLLAMMRGMRGDSWKRPLAKLTK